MEGWGAPSRAESTCRGISNLCALDLWFVFFVRSVPYLFRFLVVRCCMRGRSHWACSAGFQQAWSSLDFSTWRIMFLSRQLRLFEHERERGDGDSAGSTLHRMVHASLNLPRICLFVFLGVRGKWIKFYVRSGTLCWKLMQMQLGWCVSLTDS